MYVKDGTNAEHDCKVLEPEVGAQAGDGDATSGSTVARQQVGEHGALVGVGLGHSGHHLTTCQQHPPRPGAARRADTEDCGGREPVCGLTGCVAQAC